MIREAVIAILAVLLLIPATFAEPVENVPPGRFWVTVDGDSAAVPYLTSHPLDGYYPEITRAVLFVPAGPREVVTAGQQVMGSANSAGVTDTTLIAGLQYLMLVDITGHELENTKVAYWQHQHSTNGYPSTTTPAAPRDVFVSSFTFQDSLAVKVAEICPNLNTIVICGNSEAGKFVHRYGAVTRLPHDHPELPELVFCPMNSGSFLYMGDARMSSSGEIGLPSDFIFENIPAYNNYPYGLRQLQGYAVDSGAGYIHDDYPNRWFCHMIGTLDVGPNADFMAEALQGFNNHMRCTMLPDILEHHYGYPLERTQIYEIVGAGHSNIWDYDQIQYPLFFFTPPPDDE